ncbi:unnamed protein product [Ceutorhynchus assimilis]|uniref:Uncharacterized protein n=1 Tax=Ceutorhynchus assimilis TaxID=467358 RepID=A0A9N9QN94_9CUCU|nr:unnamed protein product [Ceutorhynchus assimilis]
MASDKILPIFLVLFTITNAAVIPTVKVLQGPGSRTSLYGPDGSALESAAPGGTLVTDGSHPGLLAAGPAHLPSSPDIVVGGGPAGKIVTSYTLAGPAVLPVQL